MIVTRAPLRISLAGGGTDIPAWYKDHGSMFVSAAINKYVYVTFYRTPFFPHIHLKYSETETVEKLDDIKHDIIRETLRLHNINDHIEIVSHADIPAGTGLGSSGSFGVALSLALESIHPDIESTHVQMDILNHPIGWQDQLATYHGGITQYEIDKSGGRVIRPLPDRLDDLKNYLAMFYTGYTRSANEVLSRQSLDGLEKVQELAYQSLTALKARDWERYGRLMDEHWTFKKLRGGMSNLAIDGYYDQARQAGAWGGKLVGAGGGGFLLFVTPDKEKLIRSMPLLHLPFEFDYEGAKVIADENIR